MNFRKRLFRIFKLKEALILVWEAAPGNTIINLVLNLFQGLIPLIGLILLKSFIDSITVAISAEEPLTNYHKPLFFLLLIGLTALLRSLINILATYNSEKLGQYLIDHVQSLIHKKSTELDLSYFETPEYFDNLHRAQQEGSNRPIRIVNGLSSLVRDLISLAGIAGILIYFSPLIFLIILIAALPGLYFKIKHSKIFYNWRRSRTPDERMAGIYDSMLTKVRFAKEVRVYGLPEYLRKKYLELRIMLRDERLRLARKRARIDFGGQLLGTLAVIGSLIYILAKVLQGVITLGSMVMYYQALQRGLSNMRNVMISVSGLYEDSLFISNLSEFLSLEPKIKDPAVAKTQRDEYKFKIEFEEVTFGYPGSDSKVLKNLSMEIESGESTALVGENGAGKTTIVKLLCRLYDPDDGMILLNGIDLKEYKVDELRDKISVVFQDFVQFPGTVKENIGFGRVDRIDDTDSIKGAARWSGADSFIEILGDEYDTPLMKWFDRGQELSIGQWQAIALARAYFRNSDIIILDEPTSALDAYAEARFFERMSKMIKDKTSVFISHRFSSVRMAQKIYVISDGKIAEAGCHDDLLKLDGLYAHMFNLQAGKYK